MRTVFLLSRTSPSLQAQHAQGRRELKKLTIMLIALFLLAPAVYAEDTALEAPHWTFDIKAGRFMPDLPDWRSYYSRNYVTEYGTSLAYKFIRQAEVGVEAGYLSAKGLAKAPAHQLNTGSVTYTLYPVNAFILFRGIVKENQWIVPYAGGGYTRMYYRESIEDQGTIKGSANGYHARAGLQILLDGLDPSASGNMFIEYGIFHTYLILEARYTHAVVSSTNLGGKSYLAGLLFEF